MWKLIRILTSKKHAWVTIPVVLAILVGVLGTFVDCYVSAVNTPGETWSRYTVYRLHRVGMAEGAFLYDWMIGRIPQNWESTEWIWFQKLNQRRVLWPPVRIIDVPGRVAIVVSGWFAAILFLIGYFGIVFRRPILASMNPRRFFRPEQKGKEKHHSNSKSSDTAHSSPSWWRKHLSLRYARFIIPLSLAIFFGWAGCYTNIYWQQVQQYPGRWMNGDPMTEVKYRTIGLRGEYLLFDYFEANYDNEELHKIWKAGWHFDVETRLHHDRGWYFRHPVWFQDDTISFDVRVAPWFISLIAVSTYWFFILRKRAQREHQSA